jgi:transposase-like protein
VQINITNLIDDIQCYRTVRELRWPDGITCPSCASQHIIKRGFDDTESARQRYECHDCDTRFDDLTDTIFAGHHQPLKVWVLCLYFMGLNLSTLILDSRVLRDQELNERRKQRFASLAHVVNELEETQVDWEFLLGNTPMRAQPTPQERPKAFHHARKKSVKAWQKGALFASARESLRYCLCWGHSRPF